MATVLHSLDGQADVVVGPSPVLVGRHPVCDLRLESFRVSRRHCTLVELDGAVLVHDLASTNGTWINGRRVSVGWAHPGDELSLAGVRYRIGDGPSRWVSAPPRTCAGNSPGPLSEL